MCQQAAFFSLSQKYKIIYLLFGVMAREITGCQCVNYMLFTQKTIQKTHTQINKWLASKT